MKKLSLIILALLVVLASCKKAPEVNLKYVDVEREVLTIGTTTATFQCDYQYITTLKSAKIYYGLGESGMASKEMQVVSSSLYAEITGLASSTTYNYYYEFYNGYNSMQSAVKTFVTESTPVTLPTVITADVTEITAESAVCGGNVTNDGGSTVTARGVCWSTSLNPTINDSFTTDGEGIGSFISNMTGLSGNITYHVRAYATNEAGTAYGLDKTFTTLNGGGGGDAPTGAINGLFTINANGDQVYFSQGNLQYRPSTNTWKFAENQWDIVGVDLNNISPTYEGWIDRFGWGTGDNPTIVSNNPDDYNTFTDWGTNAISNGGNTSNTWRTLSWEEFSYLIYGKIRPHPHAQVGGVNGLILLPDNWDNSVYSFEYDDAFTANIISLTDWSNILEVAGAVFFPVMDNSTPFLHGNYWTNSWWMTAVSRSLYFDNNYGASFSHTTSVCGHLNVRLVQDAK